jgi:4-amino-4-deoxy-L-arabinose transferase-like glycosyltransferase
MRLCLAASVIGSSEHQASNSVGKLAGTSSRATLSRKTEWGILLIVLLVALIVRVAYLQATKAWNNPPENDGIEYDLLATHLVTGRGFVDIYGQPYMFRPPGFAFFLALLYAIFGRSYAAVRLANVGLGVLTCLPIYFFTKKVWRWQAGMLASAGVAFHPLLIYLTGFIYPECLTLFCVAVAFWLVTRVRQSSRIRDLIPVGLLLGYVVSMRPNMLIFGILQTVWVWLSFKTTKQRLLACSVLVGAIFLVIVPWGIRNYLVSHRFVWMSTNGGVTLWASNNPLANGGWIEPSPLTWQGPNPPADLRGWPELTAPESEARFRAEATKWILEHPAEFVSLMPKKLVRAWSLNIGNEARPVALPKTVYVAYSLFLILCLFGFILSFSQWRDMLVLYLLMADSTVSTVVFYGSTRISVALVLALVIFASLALDRMLYLAVRFTSERIQPRYRAISG